MGMPTWTKNSDGVVSDITGVRTEYIYMNISVGTSIVIECFHEQDRSSAGPLLVESCRGRHISQQLNNDLGHTSSTIASPLPQLGNGYLIQEVRSDTGLKAMSSQQRHCYPRKWKSGHHGSLRPCLGLPSLHAHTAPTTLDNALPPMAT